MQASTSAAAPLWVAHVVEGRPRRDRLAQQQRPRHVAVCAQQPEEQNRVQAEDSSPDLVYPCSTSFPPALATDWRAFRARLVALEQGRVEQATAMHLRADVGWAHAVAVPERGALLVARKPALGMFTHGVVLVLEHDDAVGTTGIVLNMPTPLAVGQLGLEEELAAAFGRRPLCVGGPLGKERLHIVHGRRDVEDAMEVIDGVYIGGLEHAVQMVRRREAPPTDFCVLVGYSQWGPWQLAQELADDTWWVIAASESVIQDLLAETASWDPTSLNPLRTSESVKKHAWDAVLAAASGDWRPTPPRA